MCSKTQKVVSKNSSQEISEIFSEKWKVDLFVLFWELKQNILILLFSKFSILSVPPRGQIISSHYRSQMWFLEIYVSIGSLWWLVQMLRLWELGKVNPILYVKWAFERVVWQQCLVESPWWKYSCSWLSCGRKFISSCLLGFTVYYKFHIQCTSSMYDLAQACQSYSSKHYDWSVHV